MLSENIAALLHTTSKFTCLTWHLQPGPDDEFSVGIMMKLHLHYIHSIISFVLGIMIVLSDTSINSTDYNPEARLLNLFTVVKFANTDCVSR